MCQLHQDVLPMSTAKYRFNINISIPQLAGSSRLSWKKYRKMASVVVALASNANEPENFIEIHLQPF